MYQPIRDRAAILVFRSAQKNTNVSEDVEILLPVKFRQISFGGFRERSKMLNIGMHVSPAKHSYA